MHSFYFSVSFFSLTALYSPLGISFFSWDFSLWLGHESGIHSFKGSLRDSKDPLYCQPAWVVRIGMSRNPREHTSIPLSSESQRNPNQKNTSITLKKSNFFILWNLEDLIAKLRFLKKENVFIHLIFYEEGAEIPCILGQNEAKNTRKCTKFKH